MAQFYAGELKTAKVAMRNPTGKVFDYQGFLYMGTDLAVVSEKAFSLGAGEEKEVSFPVTMPVNTGVYPVHLGVFSESKNIALYRAEDVSIVAPLSIKTFFYVYQSTYTWTMPPIIHAKQDTHVGFTFTNNGAADVAGVSVEMAVAWPDYYYEYLNEFNIIERELITSAGSVLLTVPKDQYLKTISQPFVAPYGDTMVWFNFSPGSVIPGNWTAGGPTPFTVTARVRVNGIIVAERTIVTSVSYE